MVNIIISLVLQNLPRGKKKKPFAAFAASVMSVLTTIRTWHVFGLYNFLVTVEVIGVTVVLFTAIDTLCSSRGVSSPTGRV